MFSVIIPVYNHKEYLVDAITSCLSSPLVTEILVVDDGSIDGSAQLLATFAAMFPQKIRNLTDADSGNRGAHARLNQLAGQAGNAWIAVLNSDDRFGSGRFEALSAVMRKSKADLFFGYLNIIDENDARIGEKYPLTALQYPFPKNFPAEKLAERQQWLSILLHQNVISTTSNMVFRKDIFTKIGGFRDFRYIHDWDFALRVACEGQVDYVPLMTTCYRIHPKNTIKEDHVSTRKEAARLFKAIFIAYPDLFAKSRHYQKATYAREALSGNVLLRDDSGSVLQIVSPKNEFLQVHDVVSRELPVLKVVPTFSQVSPDVQYVYMPSSKDSLLSPNDLRNILLCLSIMPYDFVLGSKCLDEYPHVGVRNVRDNLVFNPAFANTLLGNDRTAELLGRVARLLPEDTPPVAAEKVFPGFSLHYDNGELCLGSSKPPLQPKLALYPQILCAPPKTKPRICILPTFIAIGGVERVMIEIMQRLQDQFEFVIVCTERLPRAFGSWHSPALPHALAVYDLPEVLPQQAFAQAFRLIKHAYEPDLVFIMNGSPWQCDNALAIRTIFRDTPIVDHQVYDNKVGWIDRFSEPALRSSDHYIAVNQRILKTFIETYEIDPNAIDLIYHPFNSDFFNPDNFADMDRDQVRQEFGLPGDKRLYAFIGRVTQQKRPQDFIALAQAAMEAGLDDAYFVMVGDGALGEECNARIRHHGLTNCKRIGFCNELSKIYNIIDGLIVTSEYEGLPVAMLEALALGVPVLATDVGDIRFVLEQYGSGLIVEEVGATPALFLTFQEWIGRLDTYKQAALVASPLLREHFSGATIVSQYQKCFEKVIQRFKGKHHALAHHQTDVQANASAE